MRLQIRTNLGADRPVAGQEHDYEASSRGAEVRKLGIVGTRMLETGLMEAIKEEQMFGPSTESGVQPGDLDENETFGSDTTQDSDDPDEDDVQG
ncbi:hypothetical protein L596_002309 [Steinernema carpocapsae]|uniref:Uncharacterized protein n=1 Tax=Steinernema carpocapsae TaxID=34508 RepID=A0A4U8UNS9_STECR|nr:hypothetical protein L596_002309 [Steinernema carpocapsae]